MENGTRVESSAEIDLRTMRLRYVGMKPGLLMHNVLSMNPSLVTKSKTAKDKAENAEQIEAMTYRDENGFLAIPFAAIRRAIIDAGAGYKIGSMGYSGRLSAAILYPDEDMIPITRNGEYIDEYEIDERAVVVQRARVIRRRPKISYPWEIEFNIHFDNNVLPPDTASSIFEFAKRSGVIVGLLDFRPNKKGWHGRYEVERVE